MQISIRRCSHKIGAVSVSAAVQVEAVVDDEECNSSDANLPATTIRVAAVFPPCRDLTRSEVRGPMF